MYSGGTCLWIFTGSWGIFTFGVSGLNYLYSVLWNHFHGCFTKYLLKGCPGQGAVSLQFLRDDSWGFKLVVRNWLIGKDPDAGKVWGQEEKGTTDDEMVGWHHRLDGHGFEWTPGVGDGQGGRPGVLQFMGSHRVRHDWATGLNWVRKSLSLAYVALSGKTRLLSLSRILPLALPPALFTGCLSWLAFWHRLFLFILGWHLRDWRAAATPAASLRCWTER